MENSTYQQDNKHVSSTILHRLVNELDLTKVLTQYVSIIEGKPVDYLVNKLKTYEQQITDKDKFWNQLGFEIKNEHREIILVLAKHSSLSHNCTYIQDENKINTTVLQRIVAELQLDELLKQISSTTKIDCLMTQLKTYPHRITDKHIFWNQLGFEIKNEHREIILVLVLR
eukprot:246637_1